MRFRNFRRARPALAMLAFMCAFNGGSLSAKDPPSDLCSLLEPPELQKALGQPFGQAQKSTAPAAFLGQPSGTHCEYAAEKGRAVKVVFIAYVDSSPTQAKQTFDKLSLWYAPASRPAIGDSAYIDAHHAIHAMKGRVRYYIGIEARGTSKTAPYRPWSTESKSAAGTTDKLVEDLAHFVADEL